MFCKECGTENVNEAIFCKKCGTKIGGMDSSGNNNRSGIRPVKPPVHIDQHGETRRTGHNVNKIIGMLAVAVVVIVVAIVGLNLFGGRGYKSVIKKYVSASVNLDVKGFLELLPEKVIDRAMEEGDMDREEMEEMISEMISSLKTHLDRLDADDLQVSYEIASLKDTEGEKLQDIKEEYEEELGLKVNAAKEVYLNLTIEYSDQEQEVPLFLDLVKINRSWYLDYRSFM